jgi:hypothetical protein
MAPIIRNIAAVVVGFIVGGFVNMGLIMLGSSIIPAPPGVDASDAESIAAGMHLFEAKHFITPFVAHAAGTLVGALVACLLAVSSKMTVAMVIGFVSLAGGIAAAFMIPAPLWFLVLDLLVAYIPMAWLGGKLGQRFGKSREGL